MGDWDLSPITWKAVLEELKEIALFRGIYDAKNGNEHYMFGISTVMEVIANKANDDGFEDEFLHNMKLSEEKVGPITHRL